VNPDEATKLIKWFARAVYTGSEWAEDKIKNMGYLQGRVKSKDQNKDGLLNRWEAERGLGAVCREILRDDWSYTQGFFDDYDFNSDEVLDEYEQAEAIKRLIRNN
jgi:hypothetical protein